MTDHKEDVWVAIVPVEEWDKPRAIAWIMDLKREEEIKTGRMITLGEPRFLPAEPACGAHMGVPARWAVEGRAESPGFGCEQATRNG